MSAKALIPIAWLRDNIDAGFEEIFLHNVGANQEAFIVRFGSSILPRLT